MPALWSLILPALIPVLADGARGVFNWLTGGLGAEPANTKEAIELMDAETRKLQAIAALDTPVGTISPWVADLRASFRYLAAGVIIVPAPFIALYGIFVPTEAVLAFADFYINALAAPVFSFIFGERMRMHFRKGS